MGLSIILSIGKLKYLMDELLSLRSQSFHVSHGDLHGSHEDLYMQTFTFYMQISPFLEPSSQRYQSGEGACSAVGQP